MMYDRKPVFFIQAVFLVPRASLILFSVLNMLYNFPCVSELHLKES